MMSTTNAEELGGANGQHIDHSQKHRVQIKNVGHGFGWTTRCGSAAQPHASQGIDSGTVGGFRMLPPGRCQRYVGAEPGDQPRSQKVLFGLPLRRLDPAQQTACCQ